MELKQKFDKIDTNMKRFKVEMYHKSTYLADLLLKNSEYKYTNLVYSI